MTAASPTEDREDVRRYVEENREVLVDVLLWGSQEARACALTFLSFGGTPEDIEWVRDELDRLHDEATA